MKTWILIADAAHARMFETYGVGKKLLPVAGFPLSHDLLRNHDVGRDRPGRTHDSIGDNRHAVEPKTDPHRQMKREFANELSRKLEDAVNLNAFDRLIIAAPPAMLSDLRHCLAESVKARIAAEVPKDLVKVPDSGLRDHFAGIAVF